MDLPSFIPEDVPDLEDMELTDSLIGCMVDDSLLMLLLGAKAKGKSDEGVDFVLPFGGTKIKCSVLLVPFLKPLVKSWRLIC